MTSDEVSEGELAYWLVDTDDVIIRSHHGFNPPPIYSRGILVSWRDHGTFVEACERLCCCDSLTQEEEQKDLLPRMHDINSVSLEDFLTTTFATVSSPDPQLETVMLTMRAL